MLPEIILRISVIGLKSNRFENTFPFRRWILQNIDIGYTGYYTNWKCQHIVVQLVGKTRYSFVLRNTRCKLRCLRVIFIALVEGNWMDDLEWFFSRAWNAVIRYVDTTVSHFHVKSGIAAFRLRLKFIFTWLVITHWSVLCIRVRARLTFIFMSKWMSIKATTIQFSFNVWILFWKIVLAQKMSKILKCRYH